jgi:hypothetical protein
MTAVLLTAICALPVFSFAQEPISFEKIGIYLSIPVSISSPTKTVSLSCALDTAAAGLWLGHELVLALESVSVVPDYQWPPHKVSLLVGDNFYEDLIAHEWSKMPGFECLIGMDLFWHRYTCFDFGSNLIRWSEESNDFQFNEWLACRNDRDAWRVRALQAESLIPLCKKWRRRKQ